MVKRINPAIKIIQLFFLIILFLPLKTSAFISIKNLPQRNNYFTGRDLDLDNLQQKLARHNLVYLTGYGGIGKTQLAKEYSYINEQKYDVIWWFDLKGDLINQYESLLTHLRNSEPFKKLIHIDVNNIAPRVLIDFTNSLLLAANCKWLLIFDNVINAKKIPIPKAKIPGQHIIITTREKQIFGDKVLTLKPFTNHEAEQFLSKVHPQEKKAAITKLSKALHNYPLALAQISEEILMYRNGIDAYLEKHDIFKTKLMPMHSSITQEYPNNYHEILNLSLQEIEQKDKEAAKFLYMLALLNIDLTQEFARDLFGDEIEEKLIILGKYGVIKITPQGNSHILNIHDIIKEEAIKRFNNKDPSYKNEVSHTLSKCFNSFYSEKKIQYLNGLDPANDHITAIYAFINIMLQHDVINEGVLDIIIIALRLNDELFNKHANKDLYNQLAVKVYNKNLKNIAPLKKASLYATLIFANFIFESKENILKFEKELLSLLNLIENRKNFSELFFIYTRLSEFYLILGDFKQAQKYSKKAEKFIDYDFNTLGLLEYWYNMVWLFYELRDIDAGLRAVANCIKIIDQCACGESKLIKLYVKHFKIMFEILVGQKEKPQAELAMTIKEVLEYYNNTPSDILGYLEFAKALMYFKDDQYDLAHEYCKRALNILNKLNGEIVISSDQIYAHILLGMIYEKKGKINLTLEKYRDALRFYNEVYHQRILDFYEYGDLLSNLCLICYKQKKFIESKFYYQKLVTNFGLEHDIVGKLIRKLPSEYMCQIDDGVKK